MKKKKKKPTRTQLQKYESKLTNNKHSKYLFSSVKPSRATTNNADMEGVWSQRRKTP